MLLVKLWAKKITLIALMGTLCVAMATLGWAQAGNRPNVRAKHKPQPQEPVDVTKLVWPLPPRVARIRYVTQVVGERDLIGVKQKKPSWLEKAAGIWVEDQERPHVRKPYGVAVDSKGHVYVGDSALHKVFVFDLDKKQLTYRGDKSPAQFSVIIGLAIDDEDRLFVSDAALHQITVFDPNGGFLSVFGEDLLTQASGDCH